jgi:hypothetical protein
MNNNGDAILSQWRQRRTFIVSNNLNNHSDGGMKTENINSILNNGDDAMM